MFMCMCMYVVPKIACMIPRSGRHALLARRVVLEMLHPITKDCVETRLSLGQEMEIHRMDDSIHRC